MPDNNCKTYEDKIDKAVRETFLQLRDNHQIEFYSLLDTNVKKVLLDSKEVTNAKS